MIRIRRELWFGFGLMAIILAAIAIFMPWSNFQSGHLGLLMLALIVVTIMLGFRLKGLKDRVATRMR